MMGDAETRIWHGVLVLSVFFRDAIIDFLKRVKSFTVVMKNGNGKK